GAAEAILVRKLITAHGGEAALGDGLFPGRDVAVILRVGALNTADGGDAHAVQFRAGFGGVALEIAVQRAILLGNGELVTGFCEVVHTDIEIACVEKLEKAGAEDFKFFHALWKVRGKGALLLFEPRHVSVAEQSDAIRGDSDDLIYSVGKSVCGLVGKSVNQIDVDAIEAELAGGEEQIARHFVRLDAVDGLLDFGLRSEEHTSELQSRFDLVCRLLLEKKKNENERK